ncbi:MAG: hypothetical protein JNL63_09260 [Bacteroidia bacterium]|nr:hypothetical protein [Bacteroidia bacterium]
MLKITILVLTTINAFLGIDKKRWKEQKKRSFAIAFLLILIFICMWAENNNEKGESLKKEAHQTLLDFRDSIYKSNTETKLSEIKKKLSDALKQHIRDSISISIFGNIVNQRGQANFSNIGSQINGNQVGKLEIKNERELQEDDKKSILNKIEAIKYLYKIKTNNVGLYITPESNGGKFFTQLDEYLQRKGYSIVDRWPVMNKDIILRGVDVGYRNGVIAVTIGVLN